MIACGDEIENITFGAKNKPQPKANAAFKVFAFETTNAQTGVQMRCSEAVTNVIDYARDLAPSRFRKGANATSETL